MRVAIFTDSFKPEISGVVTSIDTLMKELRRRGHEVFLFAPRYHGKKATDPSIIDIPSIPYPFRRMKERRLALPWGGALRKSRTLNIDVIHSHVPGTVGIYALLASWLWRVAHVHTYHTHFLLYTHYAPIPHALATRAVKWIVRHFCGRCQHVISPSQGMRKDLLEHGVDAPISVVPTGVDLRVEHPRRIMGELFEKYNLGDPGRIAGRRLLVSIGRLGREKNICFLVRALAILKAKHDVHLLMIGDGPDRGEIEREVRDLGLSGRVSLPGYVRYEDVFSFLGLAQLFIFASVTETQGLVLLESMAVGTPVVAVAGTGISDLMENDAGGLTTKHNVEEFAEAVDRLLTDEPLRRSKSAEAVSRARELSVENLVGDIVSIYDKSIEELRLYGPPRLGHRSCG